MIVASTGDLGKSDEWIGNKNGKVMRENLHSQCFELPSSFSFSLLFSYLHNSQCQNGSSEAHLSRKRSEYVNFLGFYRLPKDHYDHYMNICYYHPLHLTQSPFSSPYSASILSSAGISPFHSFQWLWLFPAVFSSPSIMILLRFFRKFSF